MQLVLLLTSSFEGYRNDQIALQQSGYLKKLFPFLGLKKPLRDSIQKDLFKKHLILSEQELQLALEELWHMPYREYQMAALDLAYYHKKLWTLKMFPVFEKMIRTKSWWDSVDTIASKLVGPLLKQYPELRPHMDNWILDDQMWIRRTAIIYQLSYKEGTDHVRLFRYCNLRMHEKEFFIRKAIGWALRNYARTNPEAVHAFAIEHKSKLAPLSFREATKHITHLQ